MEDAIKVMTVKPHENAEKKHSRRFSIAEEEKEDAVISDITRPPTANIRTTGVTGTHRVLSLPLIASPPLREWC